jgi:acetylornithine deacetylase
MTAPGPEAIRTQVGRRSDEIIAWLTRLVRFPSENRPPDGAEGEAQAFVADECRQAGLAVDVFAPTDVPGIQSHPFWLPGRTYGHGRYNVVARWKGRGTDKSLLFSGHVDVAPFEPDNWQVCRPYEPVLKDGRLYGRGTADMKGGLAAAFWALRILRDLGFQPTGDVLFESLVDEEFAGGNGTLAARLKGYNADFAVVPEPTRMEICPACFGAFLGNLILKGKGGMPYTGSAIANPIHGAARAIELFSEWEKQWRDRNTHPLFQSPAKALNVVLWKLESRKEDEFTQMGTPLQAGIAWIVWCHPGMTEEEFYRQFRAFWEQRTREEPALAPFKVTLEPDYHFVRPWETPTDHPGVRAMADVLTAMGLAPAVGGAPFSCDLAVYGDVGNTPCILLGPRGDRLHAPDEWVQVTDVMNLVGAFAELVVRWCK